MCVLYGKSEVFFQIYLQVEHPNYRPNRCKICQQSFNTQIRLVQHLYFHVNVDFKCLGCDFSSKNQKELRTHIAKTQHSTGNYHCPSCGFGFPNFNALLEHTKDLHNQKQLYPCVKCKSVSLTKADYDTHKCGPPMISRAELDEMKMDAQHTCEQCSQVFQVKEHFEIHFLTTCVETFTCEICVKVFKTRKQLYHHNRLHQERNYFCDLCGFRTTIESALKKHKIMHFDDRPHNCQKCSSAFKRKSGKLVVVFIKIPF
jgi:KRAB domain-containing zinc finger protein